MNNPIAFVDLKAQYAALKQNINKNIQQVLDHGQYIMGPEVQQLEQQLQTYTGAKYCVTVSSGTEALLISLMALGVKAGDEVITSPFTFAATAEVISLIGATPVFVDINPNTCNTNPALIAQAITTKTKAIMPVSLYGQAADLDEINAIAAKHGNIAVIEDAAQSFGSDYKGKKSCNLSTIGCTSFFPSKPLGCYGDGGAIFTNDAELATAMREIRVHGQHRRYHHTRIGVGGRMDTLQCAVVLAKLKKFDWEIEQRIAAGDYYQQLFAETSDVTTLSVASDRTCVWGQYSILVNNRDAACQQMKDKNIPTAVHYPLPLHHQPAYKAGCVISGKLDNAEKVATQVMSLPMHPYIDRQTQDTVANTLKQILQSLQKVIA